MLCPQNARAQSAFGSFIDQEYKATTVEEFDTLREKEIDVK
jgi:hypothetical protein